MDTFKLLGKLSNQGSKSDYKILIDNELDRMIKHFSDLNYKVSAKDGFIDRQVIKREHTYDSFYFIDLIFIQKGLQGNWKTNQEEELYYRGLEGFITAQHNLLP